MILGKDLLQNPHYPKVRQDERRIDLPSPGSGKAVERINRDTGIIGYVKNGKRWFQNFAGAKLYCRVKERLEKKSSCTLASRS